MNRRNQLIVLLTAFGAVSGMVAQGPIANDPCIQAIEACLNAQSVQGAPKQSLWNWNGIRTAAQGYFNSAKEYVKSINTAKIQESAQGYATSCLEAIKQDPKKAGVYAAVVVVGSYLLYCLLKKNSKKKKSN